MVAMAMVFSRSRLPRACSAPPARSGPAETVRRAVSATGTWRSRTRPELKRPFRVPFSPVVPILSALACLYLMANLSVETWIRFLAWLVVGLLVYGLYGYRHSRVRSADREDVAVRV